MPRSAFIFTLLLALWSPATAWAEAVVQPGIDVLLTERVDLVRGKRIGLVTNTSAVDAQGVTTLERLRTDPRVRLTQLYAPEHGLWLRGPNGHTDEDGVDPVTGLPVEGLNAWRQPSRKSLARVDVVVFDIQDVGSRTFTYASTLGKVLQAAGRHRVPVVVLDRPNPRGGLQVEGPVIPRRLRSAIGWGPVPVTHGLTLGELARYFNAELKLRAPLTVVKMRGWRRNMVWEDTALGWTPPSTALKQPLHAHFYVAAGMVGGAGVNADDGVSDYRTFERIAAPYADADELTAALEAAQLPGVRFHPVRYEARRGPHQGQQLGGVRLELTDARAFRPLRTALAALTALRRLYPEQFKVVHRGQFLRVWGSRAVLQGLEAGWAAERIEATWRKGLRKFEKARKRYLLYRP